MKCFSSKNKNKNNVVLSPEVTKVFVEVVKITFTPINKAKVMAILS